jgi:hypothetical protein
MILKRDPVGEKPKKPSESHQVDSELPVSASQNQLSSMPSRGTRYLVLWLLMVVFASIVIIVGTDIQTFVGVLAIGVVFVIAVKVLVDRIV